MRCLPIYDWRGGWKRSVPCLQAASAQPYKSLSLSLSLSLAMLLPHLHAYIVRKILISLLNFLRLIHLKARLSSSSSKCPSPPLFDLTQPSLPISYPIKILEELVSFHHPFNKASVALQFASSTSPLPNGPRVIVCHCRNMAAGWLWR